MNEHKDYYVGENVEVKFARQWKAGVITYIAHGKFNILSDGCELRGKSSHEIRKWVPTVRTKRVYWLR